MASDGLIPILRFWKRSHPQKTTEVNGDAVNAVYIDQLFEVKVSENFLWSE